MVFEISSSLLCFSLYTLLIMVFEIQVLQFAFLVYNIMYIFNHGLWNFKSFVCLPCILYYMYTFDRDVWNFKSLVFLAVVGCCWPGVRRSYLWKITKGRLTFMLVDFLSPFCLILERSLWKKRRIFLFYLQMYWSLFHNRPLSGS